MFGGRDTFLIFVAVFIAEKPEINIAAFYLLEINLVGAPVLGGKFLEKKHLGNETVQNRVAEQKRFEILAYLGELFLDTADEDF